MLMKKISDMTREEKLAAIDAKLDADVAVWKQYVRDSEGGLAEFSGRLNDVMVLRPIQK